LLPIGGVIEDNKQDKKKQDEQQAEAEEKSTVRPEVVYEAVKLEGEEELKRSSSALAWSGLAAGLVMGFSLVAEGILHRYLPERPWRPLVTAFGYTFGFLFVILGRQQLFTENTLTVILPLMLHKKVSVLVNVLRLWAVVLAANLAGGLAFALVAAHTNAFEAEFRSSFKEICEKSVSVGGFGTVLLRGIFAGWLIALMVWVLPAAETARVWVILLITWLVKAAGLTHIVAGAVEVFYLTTTGAMGWGHGLAGYLLPTLIGNIIGGVALVAALNHAQVVSGE
jgi:formate/nitrite transporter FocA (FNT family)